MNSARSRPHRFTRRIAAAATTILCCLGLLLLCAAPPAHAQYRVTQDLSALSGLGTFYFNFQLTDGDQTGDNDSRADIFNFALTGGSLGAVLPPTLGDAQGNLNTTLTLRDSDAALSGLADFAQAFTITGGPGSLVTFDLDLSSTAFDAPTPDGFFLYILDGTQTPLPTTGPTGIEFIVHEFVAPVVAPVGFGSLGGSTPSLPAPVITLRPAAPGDVAEPGTLALAGMGLLPLAGGVVPRRRNAR